MKKVLLGLLGTGCIVYVAIACSEFIMSSNSNQGFPLWTIPGVIVMVIALGAFVWILGSMLSALIFHE